MKLINDNNNSTLNIAYEGGMLQNVDQNPVLIKHIKYLMCYVKKKKILKKLILKNDPRNYSSLLR